MVLLRDLASADLTLAPVSACAPVLVFVARNGHAKRGLGLVALLADPLLVDVPRIPWQVAAEVLQRP